MKVYLAIYRDFDTTDILSAHKTLEGAEEVLRKHKKKMIIDHVHSYMVDIRKEEYDIYIKSGYDDEGILATRQERLIDYPNGWQGWDVKQIKVKQ